MTDIHIRYRAITDVMMDSIPQGREKTKEYGRASLKLFSIPEALRKNS